MKSKTTIILEEKMQKLVDDYVALKGKIPIISMQGYRVFVSEGEKVQR